MKIDINKDTVEQIDAITGEQWKKMTREEFEELQVDILTAILSVPKK